MVQKKLLLCLIASVVLFNEEVVAFAPSCRTVSRLSLRTSPSSSRTYFRPPSTSTDIEEETIQIPTFSKLQLSNSDDSQLELVGEEAARFSLSEQKLTDWLQFTVAVSAVLASLFYVWIYDQGPHWGDAFKNGMESLAGGDTTLAITYMLGFFAVAHSGLASLRPKAEEIVGAKVWRYVFALVSLPLAFSSIVYFINHR